MNEQAAMAKQQAFIKQPTTQPFPAILRVHGKVPPLTDLINEGIAAGVPIMLQPDTARDEIEDASAVDPSLTVESPSVAPQDPLPGTSYAGLTPAQRHSFITWSRKPQEAAPLAYRQLFLANLEARPLKLTTVPSCSIG
jgi:hypothetical protein